MLAYIGILFCLICSAFFSGSEIAYTSVNQLRLKKAAEAGSKTAALAYDITQKFDRMLSTILIGNNLVNILASSAATVIALHIFPGASGAAIATAIMTVLILIFGEIVPKIISKDHAEAIARFAAIPLRVLMFILCPVVYLVVTAVNQLSRLWKGNETESEPSVTEDDLVSMIDTAEEEDVIDEAKSDLLHSAIEFTDTTVEDILTPRTEMLAIDIEDEPQDILDEILDSPHSRLPVYEGTRDNIIGVLFLNHYLKEVSDKADPASVDLHALLMEPCFFHKTMKLPAALDEMRKRQIHLAIVMDEYGGTLGIVTLEDILEQIVGDIWDETDEIVHEMTQTGDNTYDAVGEMNVYDFFEQLDVDTRDFESEYTSVGGWATEMCASNPHVGDSFTYKNLYVVISEMDDLCVTKVSVRVTPPPEEEDE
ncbi:MAG: HlyC/CorC family transporter [Eubacteriales bacterium]